MTTFALAPASARRVAAAWLELTKPRIVLLVVLTGVPALLLAGGGFPKPGVFWGTLIGTMLAAASAASFNMYFDRDVDALMKRTATRPLPAGLLPPSAALGLGFVLAGFSWVTLLTTTNVGAALIALGSILYYAVFYTVWLKRRTPQNIVIGGGAGASAPLIAWMAVTGTITLPAVVLSAIVFLWTPPHFWALSLYRREDYERAGIPMLPVTHGETETRRQILIYTLVLVPVTLALQPLGLASAFYTAPATLLGLAFIALAIRLARTHEAKHAMQLFLFSILYLFALYLLLAADALMAALRH
ncbi:MAG TPA: heme o synthase [Candidatus Sulfotelmatobacter sp.]|nr:heme o synthase [Candidatus Sulfotelmatobacter sp.]